jgi:hypothetical protein
MSTPPYEPPFGPPSGQQYEPQPPTTPNPYPPAQPPYPGYPTYPQYPGYAPYGPPQVAPAPAKSSNRTLWIILGSVGGVLLLLCLICTVGGIFLVRGLAGSPLLGVSTTVGFFCAAEEQQRYDSAYSQLSSNLQSSISQDQFTQESQNQDTASGTVKQCEVAQDGNPPQLGSTTSSIDISLTRNGGTAQTGTVTLVDESGSWKIDSFDTTLHAALLGS